jgi:hypothetical protein
MSFLTSRLPRYLLLAVALIEIGSATPIPAINSGISFNVFSRRNSVGSLSRRGGSSSVSNRDDLSYYTNITLGGVEIEVLIDTGR